MKRILCMLLGVIVTVSLFGGCNATKPPDDAQQATSAFSVGYGQVDISPKESMYL